MMVISDINIRLLMFDLIRWEHLELKFHIGHEVHKTGLVFPGTSVLADAHRSNAPLFVLSGHLASF